jgi:hypothetical protein
MKHEVSKRTGALPASLSSAATGKSIEGICNSPALAKSRQLIRFEADQLDSHQKHSSFRDIGRRNYSSGLSASAWSDECST